MDTIIFDIKSEINAHKNNNKSYFAYEYIKEKIIYCKYQPGSAINEQELLVNLEMSRTPIREALNKLEQEGLIKIIPKRGIFVTNISLNDVKEIFVARELIEPLAAKMATKNIPKEIIYRFVDFYDGKGDDSKDKGQHMTVDREFHTAIAHFSNNKYIKKYMIDIYNKYTRYRYISILSEQRQGQAINEHMLVLNHLMKGDENGVETAMKNHIICARQAASDIIVE